MNIRDKALITLMTSLFILAGICFAAAIFGPILWPDLGATVTFTTAVPNCGAAYEVSDD